MTLSPSVGFVLLLTSSILQFLVAGMFYAVLNARRRVLKDLIEDGDKRAEQTLHTTEDARTLLTIQPFLSIVITALATGILVVSFVPSLQAQLGELGLSTAASNLFAFGVVLLPFSLALMFIGYLLPVAVISGREERFAMLTLPLLRLVLFLVMPLIRAEQFVSSRVGRLMGGAGKASLLIDEEIKSLVETGSEEGVIELDEKEMIYSILKFRETAVREVMVPRIDVVALDINATLAVALDKFITVGHSRIPLYEDSIDHIKGFLYAKDLLTVWRDSPDEYKLAKIMREPYFVPEDKPADQLLEEFQNRETHIAIVTDDYGGTAGLVTIEDLLEEIVGEIRDEYDFMEEKPYEQVSDNEYICTAGLDLDDLNDLLDLSLPTDDNDTLGGLIYSILGRVPKVSDKLQIGHAEMEVLRVKGRRIIQVRVSKLARERETETENQDSPESEMTTLK